MRIVITHLSGAYRGERRSYDETRLTVGRGRENVVRLGRNDTLASTHHAELVLDRGAWVVRDLGSTNGTFVDGRRVERARLKGGETLAFGYGGPQLLVELVELLPDDRPSIDEPHEFPYRAAFSWAGFVAAAALAAMAAAAAWNDAVLVAVPAGLGAALLFLLGLAFVRVNITVGPDGLEHQGLWRTTRVGWDEIEALETRPASSGVRSGSRCTVRGARSSIRFSPADYREGYLLATLIAETCGREWRTML